MDKRALSAVERPVLRNKPYVEKGRRSVVITCESVKIGDQEIFVINGFKANYESWFRVFCAEDDYISQDLTTQKIRWKTAQMQKIIDYGTARVPATKKVAAEIKKHFAGWCERNSTKCIYDEPDFWDYIRTYQEHIMEQRLNARHKNEADKIADRMELFGEIPEDYDEFVKGTVFDDYQYFFYDRKKKWAYCTRCKLEYEFRKDGVYHKTIGVWNNRGFPEHNMDYMCPHCGRYFRAKSIGMSRRYMMRPEWSCLVQSNGENVLTRYFLHTKDFRNDFRKPEIKTYEKFRTVQTADKQEDYEMGYSIYTKETDWTYQKEHWSWWNPSEYVTPRRTFLYNKDFECLKGTCMRYSCLEQFVAKVEENLERTNAWAVDGYMSFYRKNPAIEQIIKLGWYKLAAETICDDGGQLKNRAGRNIIETLGISREQFLFLRKNTKNNPNLFDVKLVQYAGEAGVRLKEEEFDFLRLTQKGKYDDEYKKYIKCMGWTTLHKVRRYMDEQRIDVHSDYYDYLRWIEEMGYDMRNEFNLFPKSFKKKHDEKQREYLRFVNKKQIEDIKKFNKILKMLKKDVTEDNPLMMVAEGLFIRFPDNINELRKEGEILHHCVGTYADKVMKGETSIFFIRRVDKPKEPYYTLEWKNHRVAQCRGFRNCNMTPEVKAFTTMFEEKMQEYEKAQEKQKVG